MAGDVETNPGPDDLAGQISMILDIVSNINRKQDELVSRVSRIEENIKILKVEDESILKTSYSLTSSSTSHLDPQSKESQLKNLIQENRQYAFELNYYMEENSVLKSKLDSEKKEKGVLEQHLVEVLKQKEMLKHPITELQNKHPKYELRECELKSTEVRESSELKSCVDSGVATFDKENLPDSDAQNTPNTQKTVLLKNGHGSTELNTIDETGDEFDFGQDNYSGDLNLEEGTTAHDCTKLASGKRKYTQIAPHKIKHFQTRQEQQPANGFAPTENNTPEDQSSVCSLKDEINKKHTQPNSHGYQLFMHAQVKQDQSKDANFPKDFSPESKRDENGEERKETQTHNSHPTPAYIKFSQSLEEGEDQLMNKPKNSIAFQNFMKMKEPTKKTQDITYRPERTPDDSRGIAFPANAKWLAHKNQLTSDISVNRKENYGPCSPFSEEPDHAVSGFRLTADEELPPASASIKLAYPIKETVSHHKLTNQEYQSVNDGKIYDNGGNVERNKRSEQMQGKCDVESQGCHANESQIKHPPDKPKMQIKKGKEIPNRTLHSIAQMIGSDWIGLMRTLDMEEPRREIIEVRYINLDERAFQGLLHWKRKLGSDATLDELKAALERVNRRDLRERLEADELT